MDLQTLLGDLPKSQFVRDFYFRQPYSRPGGAESVCSLGSWQVLEQVLAGDNADVMVVREGQQHAGADPKTREAAQGLVAEGYTILVRHAEAHHPELAQLAASFAEDFRAAVNIHLYVTPAGSHGFSWHYDAEDVFIMQTTGRKEYSLRKNTVHPWPLVESMPRDLAYPREIMPLMRVLLGAGDWLYIPCGYWHKAEAPPGDEPAISLALGVMTPAALDLLDFLRPRLLDSILWRSRLPITGAAQAMTEEEARAAHGELIEQLVADLSRRLRDEKLLRDFTRREQPQETQPQETQPQETQPQETQPQETQRNAKRNET